MNAFILLRSELLHSLGLLMVASRVQLQEGNFYDINDNVIKGCLALHRYLSYRDYQNKLFATWGIVDQEFFINLYPSLNEVQREKLATRTIGQPYGIVFFHLDSQTPYIDLAEWKGKFRTNEYPDGTGIRKELRKRYSLLDTTNTDILPGNGGNFLHTPDSIEEVEKVLELAWDKSLENERSRL